MPNQTEDVKELVDEVLATLPTPYSEDVIDEVFQAIEADPTWQRLSAIVQRPRR